ncbi:MAG: C40 family peptidase [Bacteroidia bacterium]
MKRFLCSLFLVAGLSSFSLAANSPLPTLPTTGSRDTIIDNTSTDNVIKIDFQHFEHITLYAQVFQGIPYRWGGASEEGGFDCSGFICYLLDVFGYQVPHSAAAISNLGTSVTFDNLQKGDMVFFQTNKRKRISHMGMVIDTDGGKTKVIHASSSRGIVIEDLKTSTYLRTRYVKATRLDLEAIRKPVKMITY